MIKHYIVTVMLSMFFNLCSAQDNTYTLLGHSGKINSLAFTKDNSYLLSASQDGTIKTWKAEDNFRNEKTLTVSDASITSINMSPSGDEFTASSYKHFYIYSFPLLKKLEQKKNAHTTFVTSANYSKNQKFIVTTCWRDNTLILWNRTKLSKEKIFVESEWTDLAIFINDDKYIASANHTNTIKIWDVNSGNLVRTLAAHTDWVYGMVQDPEGKLLYSASLDGTIKVWDTSTWKIIKSVQAHNEGISSISISSNGKYLATTSLDKTIKLWKTYDLKEILQLSGHQSSVLTAVFSSDLKYLATGSTDKTIKIWDISLILQNQ